MEMGISSGAFESSDYSFLEDRTVQQRRSRIQDLTIPFTTSRSLSITTALCQRSRHIIKRQGFSDTISAHPSPLQLTKHNISENPKSSNLG
jgi:hypothetical protein